MLVYVSLQLSTKVGSAIVSTSFPVWRRPVYLDHMSKMGKIDMDGFF